MGERADLEHIRGAVDDLSQRLAAAEHAAPPYFADLKTTIDRIDQRVGRILEAQAARPTISWAFGPVREQHLPPVERSLPMQLKLKDNQDCPFEVVITDAKGAPAEVQSPVWTSSDEALFTVLPAPDGNPLGGVVHAVAAAGKIGAGLLTLTGDADTGEGVSPIIATADVIIGGSRAAVMEIKFGTPVDQAPA